MAFRLSDKARKAFLEAVMPTGDRRIPGESPTTVSVGGQTITGFVESVEVTCVASKSGMSFPPRYEATLKMRVSSLGDHTHRTPSPSSVDIGNLLSEAREVSKLLAEGENYGVAFIIEKLVEALEFSSGVGELGPDTPSKIGGVSVADFVDRYMKHKIGPGYFREMLEADQDRRLNEMQGQTGHMKIQESSDGGWKDVGPILAGSSIP